MPVTPTGRALSIMVGALGGGCLGFYYKETYWVKRKEVQLQQLQEELTALHKERVKKEKMVAALKYEK